MARIGGRERRRGRKPITTGAQTATSGGWETPHVSMRELPRACVARRLLPTCTTRERRTSTKGAMARVAFRVTGFWNRMGLQSLPWHASHAALDAATWTLRSAPTVMTRDVGSGSPGRTPRLALRRSGARERGGTKCHPRDHVTHGTLRHEVKSFAPLEPEGGRQTGPCLMFPCV